MSASRGAPESEQLDQVVEVGRELIRLAQIIVRLEEKELINVHGLSYRQMRILKHIHNGVSLASELASRFGITPPAISETIESMVKKGLVKRHLGAAQDRRTVILELTPDGERLYKETQASEDRLAAEILSFITPAQVRQLGKVLEKLVDNNQQRLFERRQRKTRRKTTTT